MNKRLIDANALGEVLADFEKRHRKIFPFTADGYRTAQEIVAAMRTVDAVEVVSCRACPSYHAYTNAKHGRGLCTHFMHEMPEDGFCSECPELKTKENTP